MGKATQVTVVKTKVYVGGKSKSGSGSSKSGNSRCSECGRFIKKK